MKKRIIRLTAGGLLFAAGLIIPQQFRIVKIALYAACRGRGQFIQGQLF